MKRSQEYLYVRRQTDSGLEVWDVIWSGGGNRRGAPKEARFHPEHICTAPTVENAALIAELLQDYQEDDDEETVAP